MTETTSLLAIVQTLIKWKKSILITTLLIGIVSGIILFLKPNYFKAETIFYAANPTLANPDPIGNTEKDRFVYGTSEDLDRIFSIVSSEEMVQHLIKKFRLYTVYHLDSMSNAGRHQMRLAFRENFTVSKSKYDALVLSVEDQNPELAATIANYARDRADSIAQLLIKRTQINSLASIRAIVAEQEKKSSTLIDTLKFVKKKYDLIEASYQARALADELVKAQGNLAESKAKTSYYKNIEGKQDSFIKYQAATEGYNDKVALLNQNLNKFNIGVGDLKKMEQEYIRLIDQLSIYKEKEKVLRNINENKFSAIHLVDAAQVPVYKSRPKRSLLVAASLLIGFLLSVCGVLLIESFYKK